MVLRRSSGDGEGQDCSWPFFRVFFSARRQVMTGHKFAIGQIVEFDARVTPLPRPSGPFEVTRVLPAEDVRSRTYRIKSKAEPFERSAKEYEIVSVGQAPTRTSRDCDGVAVSKFFH
jgi:hypothetical protein